MKTKTLTQIEKDIMGLSIAEQWVLLEKLIHSQLQDYKYKEEIENSAN